MKVYKLFFVLPFYGISIYIMASIYTITEEDLFNFESFCDSKYSDATCQKYGFFKIKLDERCAGECSSLNDFFTKFGVPFQKKIRKSVILQNPQCATLYGHQNVLPTAAEKSEFLLKSLDQAAFQNIDVSLNCCLQALQAGEESFLNHFYSKVTAKPKVLQKSNKKDISSIRTRAVAKKESYQKRQLYKSSTSMEGKKRCLELAMLSETILESSSYQCSCDACNIEYTLQHVPKSTENEEEDLPLLYSAGIEENQNNYLYLTQNFAMAHLCYKNMLADLDCVYGGVSYPALYLGGPHSIFALHVEDLGCWSFNYLFHGFPKFWIIIPPTSVSRLTDALQRRGFHGAHRWCRNTLNHKFYIPNPQFLKEENIPFELVFQNVGEGIVVLPNSAHAGGNLGQNLAEACNFGTNKWIPYGCVAPNCQCMENAVHADLSDLVAVHEPTLLEAYLANIITNTVEDQYFKKSIVVPGSDMTFGYNSVSAPPADHGKLRSKRRKLEGEARIRCPVCNVSWASVQKKNIMSHINKYHSSRKEEVVVIDFLKEYSLGCD